jgi:LacI family transcriptional regulator
MAMQRSERTRARMSDVAAHSGVSLKTVSRVVNGEAGVSKALTERVNEAIAALNYRHNFVASSLRRSQGRTKTLGVIVDDIANPFFSKFLRELEDIARERGVEVLSGSVAGDPEREAELVENFISRGVDGLIIVPTAKDHSYLESEVELGTSLLFLDRPAGNLNIDVVISDNASGIKNATTGLIAIGHTRIAYLGDNDSLFTATERFIGYQAALKEANLKFDPEIAQLSLRDKQKCRFFLSKIFSGANRPSAIISGQNEITVEIIRFLHSLNLQNEIALIAFDELPYAELLSPKVATIQQDIKAIAQIAAEQIFARIEGAEGKPRKIVVPTQIDVQESALIKPITKSGSASRR